MSATATATGITTWPGRAESWLDDKGKGAWIAAMVLGFIFMWPVGLALLAYMIWGKKMFGKNCSSRSSHRRAAWATHAPSGNSAFDSYKSETLKRLEDEQAAFSDFLRRLREAKDQSEFDAFMTDRERKRADEARTVEPAN
jgi:predicted CopG family antitoxin